MNEHAITERLRWLNAMAVSSTRHDVEQLIEQIERVDVLHPMLDGAVGIPGDPLEREEALRLARALKPFQDEVYRLRKERDRAPR